MKVPLVDLKAQYLSIREEIDAAVARVHERSNYVMGEEVERFEEAWAAYCGAKHCVAVGSGTAALYLSFVDLRNLGNSRILGVHTAIIPDFTFIATAQAAIEAGLKVELRDVGSDGLLPDVSSAPPPGVTLVPVHLYGKPVTPSVQKRHLCTVIEDSAQAHGQKLWGDLATYSFYPTKNLGAYGQAGAIIVDDDDTFLRLRRARNHGEEEAHRFYHTDLSGNHRLDELQAAVLNVKLPYLNRWNAARRKVAGWYRERWTKLGLTEVFPMQSDDPGHVYHILAFRVPSSQIGPRDELALWLRNNKDIQIGIRYPYALHQQPAIHRASKGFIPDADFPWATCWAREVLNLPIYPELSEEAVEYVCAAVCEWAEMKRRI